MVETEALTRGDILAYSDAAFTDLTVQKMKRSGNGVISGTPLTAGTTQAQLSVSNGGGSSTVLMTFAIVNPGETVPTYLPPPEIRSAAAAFSPRGEP